MQEVTLFLNITVLFITETSQKYILTSPNGFMKTTDHSLKGMDIKKPLK